MDAFLANFDIFLLEAVVNGLLLGGLFAAWLLGVAGLRHRRGRHHRCRGLG